MEGREVRFQPFLPPVSDRESKTFRPFHLGGFQIAFRAPLRLKSANRFLNRSRFWFEISHLLEEA